MVARSNDEAARLGTRAATGAQIKQFLPQAAKRTVINRHAFARAETGCYYESEGRGIARCTDAAPVAGRAVLAS